MRFKIHVQRIRKGSKDSTGDVSLESRRKNIAKNKELEKIFIFVFYERQPWAEPDGVEEG